MRKDITMMLPDDQWPKGPNTQDESPPTKMNEQNEETDELEDAVENLDQEDGAADEIDDEPSEVDVEDEQDAPITPWRARATTAAFTKYVT
jgi:hypothetical protein